jgi:hypothetical protein
MMPSLPQGSLAKQLDNRNYGNRPLAEVTGRYSVYRVQPQPHTLRSGAAEQTAIGGYA